MNYFIFYSAPIATWVLRPASCVLRLRTASYERHDKYNHSYVREIGLRYFETQDAGRRTQDENAYKNVNNTASRGLR